MTQHAPIQPDAPITPDALARHWSLRFLPRWTRPYVRLMRLERPIGWQLLLWPCVWASLLASIASDGGIRFDHLILFFIGSVVMRSAGCTLNDIADRDIDAKVARTAARPIPSGEISAKAAAVFLCVLMLIGFAVLISFNLFTIVLGISALALVAIYPFMKRITNWPQIVLGLAFAWGGLVGWSAQMGGLAAPALLVYTACVIWIVAYDTIYAFQDLEDDVMAGVGSSALALGDKAPVFIGISYAAVLVMLGAAMVLAQAGWPSFIALLGAAGHFGWQVKTLDITDPVGSLRRFKSNGQVGLLVALGLALDVLI